MAVFFYHAEDYPVLCVRKKSSEIKLHDALVQRKSRENLAHSMVVAKTLLCG